VLQLRFERRDRGVEHAAVGIRSRGLAVRARLTERQFKSTTSILRLAFHRRERTLERAAALGFRLLELHVLALESTRHPLTVFYRDGDRRDRAPRPTAELAAARRRPACRRAPRPRTWRRARRRRPLPA